MVPLLVKIRYERSEERKRDTDNKEILKNYAF